MVDFEQESNSEEQARVSASERLAQLRARAWFGWLLWAILVVIIILAIIFGVRAIRHHHNNSIQPTPANTKQLPTPPSTSSDKNKSSSANSNRPGSTNNSGKSGSGSSTASGPSLKNGQQLTDTGPGDVVAIFLGVSFAAAALHYMSGSRRKI